MALRKFKPTSPGRRFMTVSTFEEVTRSKPEKSLTEPVKKTGGRNNYVPGAPAVKNLGTGFVVSGTVLEAGTGQPVRNTRIQIWLNTARGGIIERELL